MDSQKLKSKNKLAAEPFTKFVNANLGTQNKTSSYDRREDEALMRITTSSTEVSIFHPEAEIHEEAIFNELRLNGKVDLPPTTSPPTPNAPTKEVEETGEASDNQLIPLEDPTPIQFDASECNRESEAKTSSRVHQNIVKLSKEFGALFDDLEKEAEILLIKLDKRKGQPNEIAINNQQLVTKEVRNLICEVKYKDSEPTSESRKGRRPPISDQ